MEEFGTHDPLPAYLTWEKLEARVALPENRPLPIPFVNQNERGLALAIWRDDPVGLDFSALHFGPLHRGQCVVADLSNVARLQAPCRTRHHGAGNLAAREDFRAAKFHLG